MSARYVAIVMLYVMVMAPSQDVWGTTPVPAPSSQQGAALRLREGETIELTGKLELSGDRAIFTPQEGQVSLRVLENLALERITQMLSESRDERQWLVRGVVTEYRGVNYILITKAVQRARK